MIAGIILAVAMAMGGSQPVEDSAVTSVALDASVAVLHAVTGCDAQPAYEPGWIGAVCADDETSAGFYIIDGAVSFVVATP